jgi:hypothetical protein
MLEIKAPDSEFTAARGVANHTTLVDVFLVSVSVDSNLHERVGVPKDFTLKKQIGVLEPHYRVVDERTLLVETGVDVNVVLSTKGDARKEAKAEAENENENENENELHASIRIVYALEYTLPEPPIPEVIEKEGFPAFAKLNGPYIAWPYIRQQVHHITASMGTPMMLPLLRVSPESEGDQESEVEE